MIDREALLVCWVLMLVMWLAGFVVGRWMGRLQLWHELTVSIKGHWKKADRKRRELDLLWGVSNAAIALFAWDELKAKTLADFVKEVEAEKTLMEKVKALQAFEEEKLHDSTNIPHG